MRAMNLQNIQKKRGESNVSNGLKGETQDEQWEQ
jgi:hypothetical protein